MIKFFYFCFLAFATITQALTIEECIDKTLKNHPDIKKFSLNTTKSKSSVDIAKSDYMPQINIGAQYNPINTFAMPQNGRFNTLSDDSWQADASVNQKIYDFSKTTSTIKAYEKDENIANLSFNDAKAFMVYSIKNQYELALFQTKALDIRKKDLQTKEELYKQAQALVKEGLKTAADATTVLSALYVAEDNLAITKADLSKTLSKLSLYMGEKIDFDTPLKESIGAQESQNVQNTDLLLENVFAKNLSLKSSLAETEKSSLIYDAVKAQNYGSIDAIASYTHQNSLNEYDITLIGVSFKIPIYTGGRVSAQTQQASISKEMAKESYNSKKLLIQEEVESLIIDLQRYKHTIKAKEALIESSKATKEVVEARYKEGLSTYIEILDAASTHLYAELGLIEAKFAINKIINQLEYLQGETK